MCRHEHATVVEVSVQHRGKEGLNLLKEKKLKLIKLDSMLEF